MHLDKDTYCIAGGIFLLAVIFLELIEKEITFGAMRFGFPMVRISQISQPKIFWFIILCELTIALLLFYEGHFKGK